MKIQSTPSRHPIRHLGKKTPNKPRPDFPLFPHQNGQWCKKVHGVQYRFGLWRTDLKGERALKDWLDRKDAILAGLDKLRVSSGVASDLRLGELMQQYLTERYGHMKSGDLSLRQYGDYVNDLKAFVSTVGVHAVVAAMGPMHFSAYAKHLTEKRKLGRFARKRIISNIKAMLNWGAGMSLHPSPTFGSGFKAPNTKPAEIRKAKARTGENDYSERIVTGAELDKLIDLATPQFKALILVGINCGIGPADIGRLRWREIDMATGELDAPRGKTGAKRRGYLWKRTRRALERVRTLKRNAKAIASDGQDALVFVTRRGHPMYRDKPVVKDGQIIGVKSAQAISITFRKLVIRAKLADGVTFYRFRHTFKTLGKRAKDRDALDLAMGHVQPGVGATYDHEDIGLDRIKRVAVAVKHGLWPKRQHEAGNRQRTREGAGVSGTY